MCGARPRAGSKPSAGPWPESTCAMRPYPRECRPMVPTFLLTPTARRRLAMGVVLTAVLVAAAGCGRRGALEAPPGATVAPTTAQPQRLVAPVAEVTTSDFGDLDTNPD